MVLRFDPDSLSLVDWDAIDAVEREPGGPDGNIWPPDTPVLRKLAAWASYALWLCERELTDDDA